MPIPPIREAGDSEHIQDHNDISAELASRLPLSGGTLTGQLNGTSATFTGNVSAATPTSNGHLTNKEYVDTAISGVGGVEGLSNVVMFEATVTPSTPVPWYGAVFPSGSYSEQIGLNSAYHFFFAGVTLPAGSFSTPPYVIFASPGRTTNLVQCFALSNTSIFAVYSNFEGLSGKNTGQVIGAAPQYAVNNDTVKFMAVQP